MRTKDFLQLAFYCFNLGLTALAVLYFGMYFCEVFNINHINPFMS